jgi:hypothetical protein
VIPMVQHVQTPNGVDIPGQFHIIAEDGSYFQSVHDTLVHRTVSGAVTLDPRWKRSKNTMKYVALFLRESTEDTRAGINSGAYQVRSLK